METSKEIQEKIELLDNPSFDSTKTIIGELLSESEQSRDEFKYDKVISINKILKNNIQNDKINIINVLKKLDYIGYEALSIEQQCYYKTLLYNLFI